MRKNICPLCGSKQVTEINYGSEGRDTRTEYHMPEYIFNNVKRDFYCYNCRKVYDSDTVKKKAESDKKKSNENVVLCVIFEGKGIEQHHKNKNSNN